MPVTKTAKRALRVSIRKQKVNKAMISRLEAALRIAKRKKNEKDIKEAISLADKASKKNIIHKNNTARIKSALSKLLSQKRNAKTVKTKAKK